LRAGKSSQRKGLKEQSSFLRKIHFCSPKLRQEEEEEEQTRVVEQTLKEAQASRERHREVLQSKKGDLSSQKQPSF